MNFEHLTPEAIRELPQATVVQLVADSATQASAECLRLLLAAGVFDRSSSDRSLWQDKVPSSPFHPLAFTPVAALGCALSSASQDHVTAEPSTSKPFTSACAYPVKWLAAGDDYKAAFMAVVRRFIDQHCDLAGPPFEADVAPGLEIALDSRSTPVIKGFRSTCGVLLATAAAMGEVQTMRLIFDGLDDGVSAEPLLQRPGMDLDLFSSDALYNDHCSGLHRMWHPVRSAIAFSKPDCIDAFAARGWRPEVSAFLCTRASTEDHSPYAVCASDRPDSVVKVMGHMALPEATPKVAERLLAALSMDAIANASKAGGDLQRWLFGLFSGDEHEIDMIDVAIGFGLCDHAPVEVLEASASEGCWPVMAAALSRVDWSRAENVDPIADVLASRWWCGGPMNEVMAALSEKLIDALEEAGQGHRLLDRVELSPASSFAQKGSVGPMVRCIEAGADPSVVMSNQNPQAPFSQNVTAALRSCHAKRIAESALAEIQMSVMKASP